LLAVDHRGSGATSPIFNYPYGRTREALDRLARSAECDPCHGIKLRYTNPLTTDHAIHHYRYAPAMSTFLVECDRSTWLRAGFDKKSEEETRRYCEDVFALTLEGQGLVSNRSFWCNIPWVSNDRWSFRSMVLIGNALHTAHFSPHG
jgi:gentisate 1,2-dioxygenase